MKLSSVDIVKFGQLRDLKILDLHPKLTVIFGDNESGKTSLMEFIRSGMFEAGRKGNRYPAAQDDDRGHLKFQMDDGSPLVLQRRKNKIENQNGGPIPADIFNSMDLNTYEHIFAMDLINLHNHDPVTKNDQLRSRFLSVAGAHRLNDVRNFCTTELTNLLGQRKSKKLMETVIAEIDALEKDIKAVQSEMDGYEDCQRRLADAEDAKAALKAKRDSVAFERKELQTALDHRENWSKMMELQSEIERLSYSRGFPEDGLESYRKWNDQLLAADEGRQKKQSELVFLKSQIESYRPDAIMGHSSKIKRMDGLREKYRSLQRNITEKEQDILRLEGDIQEAEEALGWHLNYRQIQLDLELSSGLKCIEETLERIRASLDSVSSKIEARLDSPATYGIDNTGWERLLTLSQCRDEEKELQSELNIREARYSIIRLVLLASSSLALISGAIISVVGSLLPWGAALMTVATAGLGWVGLVMPGRQVWRTTLTSRLQELREKTERLAGEGMDTGEAWEAQLSRLQKDAMIVQRNEERENRLEELKGDREKLEQKQSEVFMELQALLRKKGMPSHLGISESRDSLSKLQALQKYYRDLEGLKSRLVDLKAENLGYENELEELFLALELDCPDFITGTAILMERLEKAQTENNRHEARVQEFQRGSKDIESRMEGASALECRIAELMGDMDKDCFLRTGEDHASLRDYEKTLHLLRSSMAGSLGGEEGLNRTIEALKGSDASRMETRAEELRLEAQSLDEGWEQTVEQIYGLNGEIERMRNDTDLTCLSQRLETKQAEMMTLLRRYSRSAVSLHLLNEASDKFMREKQPRVIASADRYLDMMTSGRYRMTLDPSSMEVTVQSKEGMDRKTDGQWSSGLGDQIHLSLRLAMAEEMSRSESLPLILDDVLVRFDQNRRRGAARAIHEFAQKDGGRQVLLFTCDHATQQMFKDLPDVSFLRMREGRLQPETESLTISA